MDQQAKDLFETLPDEHKQVLNKCIYDFTPVRFRDVKFSLIDEEYQKTIKEVLNESNPISLGLFLSGPVGTGKTSVLYVILKHYLLRHHVRLISREGEYPATTSEVYGQFQRLFQFVTHFNLVRILRQYYSGNTGDLGEEPSIFYRPLVFVDDLGRGYDDQSGWNLALLDEYFDMRWQQGRTVFVSTNKTPEELRNWPGWERIIDRLCDPSWMRTLVMEGKSKRKQIAEARGESR